MSNIRIRKIKSKIKKTSIKKKIYQEDVWKMDKETYAKMEKLYIAQFGRLPWHFWGAF